MHQWQTSRVTWWTLVLVLILGSGLGWQLLSAGSREIKFDMGAVSRTGFFIWMFLYGCMGASLLLGFSALQRAIRYNILVVALFVLVIFSAAWSSMPVYALYTGLQFSFIGLFALMAGEQLPARQVWSATALAFSVIVAVSIGFIALLPDYGIVNATQNRGAWRGGFLEKNVFGTFMTFSFATAFAGIFILPGARRAIAAVAALICLSILVPTRATTALLIAVAVPLTAFFAISTRRSRGHAAFTIGVVVVFGGIAGALGLLFYTEMLNLVGKDVSLTGRDELWVYSIAAIAERPLGFGFGSFWDEQGPFGGVNLTRSIPWGPRSAHNVWLEIGLQLGLPGIALFAAFLIQLFHRMLRNLYRVDEAIVIWPWLLVFTLLWFGFVESHMFVQQSISQLLMMLMASVVARQLSRAALPVDRWKTSAPLAFSDAAAMEPNVRIMVNQRLRRGRPLA